MTISKHDDENLFSNNTPRKKKLSEFTSFMDA